MGINYDVGVVESGRRGGNMAHKIKDYVWDGSSWWVNTPRYDWHLATEAEMKKLGVTPYAGYS